MKVHSIRIYQIYHIWYLYRERDQCNIQNYKFEKQILQIQLNAEHNRFDLSDTSAFQQNSKGKVWSRYATQASDDICFATFSELENEEIARWHFEKVQKAEEDVEKIVIQSPP